MHAPMELWISLVSQYPLKAAMVAASLSSPHRSCRKLRMDRLDAQAFGQSCAGMTEPNGYFSRAWLSRITQQGKVRMGLVSAVDDVHRVQERAVEGLIPKALAHAMTTMVWGRPIGCKGAAPQGLAGFLLFAGNPKSSEGDIRYPRNTRTYRARQPEIGAINRREQHRAQLQFADESLVVLALYS